MRADLELSVVDLPRTLARVAQVVAHRFGVVEEFAMRRVGGSGGTLSMVIDGPEPRITNLVRYLERVVGVTHIDVRAWAG